MNPPSTDDELRVPLADDDACWPCRWIPSVWVPDGFRKRPSNDALVDGREAAVVDNEVTEDFVYCEFEREPLHLGISITALLKGFSRNARAASQRSAAGFHLASYLASAPQKFAVCYR